MADLWDVVKKVTMNNPYSAPSLLLNRSETIEGLPDDIAILRDSQRSSGSVRTGSGGARNSGSLVNDLTSDISLDSLTTGNIGITIFIQLLCCAIFLYASYINVKCHCPSFWWITWYGVLMACCPLCTVPYLFYKKFSSKCY